MKTDIEERLRASMEPMLRLPAPERRTGSRLSPASRWRLVAAASTAVAVAAAMVAIILAGQPARSSHPATPPRISTSATPSGSPTPSPESVTGSWQITSTSIAGLVNVACVSTTDCWAVGAEAAGVGPGGLIEGYSGSGWSAVSSPSPTGSISTVLSGVGCTSASDCWIVGDYVQGITAPQQTLIERDAGGDWSIVPSPKLPGTAVEGSLTGVACDSTGDCWAVGWYSDTDGEPYQPLVEHYAAGAWSAAAGSLPTGDVSGQLYGVTCASASDCWAVGEDTPELSGTTIGALIDHYDGSGWSLVASPATPTGASGDNSLWSVTCVSVIDCWAAGEQGTGGQQGGDQETLIERYTGGVWTVVDSPTPQPFGFLKGVTCASASDCWAVGTSWSEPNQQPSPPETETEPAGPLIESYTGGVWAIVPSGTTSSLGGLSAVTCLGSGDCWAVGGGVVEQRQG
jgi:hypothetical protein